METTDRNFLLTCALATSVGALAIQKGNIGLFGLSPNETKKLFTGIALVNLGIIAVGWIAGEVAAKMK